MNNKIFGLIAFASLSACLAYAQNQVDSSPHIVQFVSVEPDVKLEVIDWGGSGRALVFLAGLGNTAHTFDNFASQFTSNYHVYGVTRRGFGTSSKPVPASGNYAADRLGDDVLAVIGALKLNRPVLVGHSLAGEELSSIGSRHPEKVAGLIYLDAAYGYAFYDRAQGDMILDTLDLKKRIDALEAGAVENHQFMGDLLASVSQVQKDLQQSAKRMADFPDPPASQPHPPPIMMAIMLGTQKYTEIHDPILAIFACPHNLSATSRNDPKASAARIANDLTSCSAQAEAFESGIPFAHVIRLPNADHDVFNSNQADVLREMNAFLAELP